MTGRRPLPTPDADDTSLVHHVLDTVDVERQQLAHRLHDGPQQVLTAIRLLANGVSQAMDVGDQQRARDGLRRLEQLAGEAADELRRLSSGLHPVVLEQRGLVQALGALAEILENEYGLAATFARARDWRPGDDERDAGIYLVAREWSLDAVRRGAAAVAIELGSDGDGVRMSLRASGCPRPEGRVGQLLHERANRIGGSLSVSGDDPVTVVLTAP
jgi:signal transduction histidine kinase